jgi:hypothetical protein
MCGYVTCVPECRGSVWCATDNRHHNRRNRQQTPQQTEQTTDTTTGGTHNRQQTPQQTEHTTDNRHHNRRNRRNHDTPAHRPRNYTLNDMPPIRFVFLVTQKDLRNSLIMAGYCRNKYDPVYRIKVWYRSVHSVVIYSTKTVICLQKCPFQATWKTHK